ncbi:MAG: hypothetical protein WCD70_06155 [Alphaproteobacteria bacterium]
MLPFEAGNFDQQGFTGLLVGFGAFPQLVVKVEEAFFHGLEQLGLCRFGFFKFRFQSLQAQLIFRVFVSGQAFPQFVNDGANMLRRINLVLECLQYKAVDFFQGKALAGASGVAFSDAPVAFVITIAPALACHNRHAASAMTAFE